MNLIELYVNEEDDGRLDSYLSNELDEVSRTKIQGLIREGLVLVNGEKKKPRYTIKEGDIIQITIPKPKVIEILPENIDLDIVYEDDDIAIINKSQGMVVHPAPGNYSGTLVNGLLYHMDSLSSLNEIIRPGIVHRLDKDTSGLLIIAKNNDAHRFLADKLKKRDIKRVYIALVHGVVKDDSGIINAPIGRDTRDRKKMAVLETNGKEAITRYSVLKRYSEYTLVEAELETGRTHQIRVHFAHEHHPIVGDPTYSRRKTKFNLKGQLLHSIKIGFIHPRTGMYMEFETDMPKRFTKIIDKIN